MDDNSFSLSTYEKELISTLREEAREVKDCFTRFSFQAIIFTSIGLGVVAKYHTDILVVSLACTAIIFFLLAVARIGTYKYATANRNFGYELHLFRSRYSTKDASTGWQVYMKEIGWEEAMRAWRVVQATIFQFLYSTHNLVPNYLKKTHREKDYRWFEPQSLVVGGTSYHAGSYLRTMLKILFALTILTLTPLVVFVFQLYPLTTLEEKTKFIIGLSLIFLLLAFIILRMLKTNARRKILEEGLLCIHSCAIMWQATVVAHYRALEITRKENQPAGVFYRNYTKNLSIIANDLKDNIFDIHAWIHDRK